MFKETDKSKVTPAMKQYFEIKSKYPDSILLFRMGDFYEMFADDAQLAVKILDIALTSRDGVIPMCGVPHHSAHFYISKLIKAGHKVALCEQLEDASTAKGIVKRDVIRVITPGLITEIENLSPNENNFISVVCYSPNYAMAYADVTTGDFFASSFNTEQELLDKINQIAPKEVITKDKELEIKLKGIPTFVPDLTWDITKAKRFVNSLVSPDSDDKELLETFTDGEFLAIYILCIYVSENLKDINIKFTLPKREETNEYVFVDSRTLKNLEIFETHLGTEGSLFWLLDKTKTPMGKRTLRYILRTPLLSPEKIQERLEGVEELIAKKLYSKISSIISKISDIERLSIRLSRKIINPKELWVLKDSLKSIPQIREILSETSAKILTDIADNIYDFSDFISDIERTIKEEPPYKACEYSIKKGVSEELDSLYSLKEHADTLLYEFEKKEREKTGLSVRVGYNKVFGHFLDVPKGQASRVPDYFKRKQTLSNIERFTTDELEILSSKIETADERIRGLCEKIYGEFVAEKADQADRILKISKTIGFLDVLCSFAEVSEKNRYTKPRIDKSCITDIKKGRHPIVEVLLRDERFVPNDTTLNENERTLIITGANMSGKSTLLRQVALIHLIAQCGCFVPADDAKIGIVDKIFFRTGASDDTTRGRSTFFAEMEETSFILKNATERSLVVLDEIGRGTSTYDGISIAWATAEYIHTGIKARCIFATHFHELSYLEDNYEGIKNWHFGAREWNNRVIFIRRIQRGAASRSYGVHVANLAGMPTEIVESAKRILFALEEGDIGRFVQKASGPIQIGLFSYMNRENRVSQEIRKIDIEKISPMEALQILYNLKKIDEK